MKLNKRSILAVTISMLLAACGSDSEPTVPFPDKPEPLVPAPAEQLPVPIGDVMINATKEELVVTSNTEDDKLVSIEAFKGIRFAEAERFQHSNTVDLTDLVNSDGIVDATSFGDACPQLKTVSQTQSEDCLNLNIWRPAGVDSDADLPVYVFIHGGDFEYGSGSEALVHGDTVVAQGSENGITDESFIYVSFNYRLGLLGSKWVDGKANPEGGNFGIGDQKNALKWVKENIDKFGGNTRNITVLGQGSGAMSIGILMEDEDILDVDDPYSSYFQQAIMQSNPYGYEYASYDVAEERTEDYDLSGMSDVEDILKVQAKISDPGNQILGWLKLSIGIDPTNPLNLLSSDNTPMSALMPFAPYVEYKKYLISEIKGYHLTQQPVQTGLKVPTVIGVNAHESNSFGMLPSLTFLAPMIISELCESGLIDIELICGGDSELSSLSQDDIDALSIGMINWLGNDTNKKKLLNNIGAMSEQEMINQAEAGLTAYGVVTKLFFGELISLGGESGSSTLLNLSDYYPNPESEIGGTLDNMKQLKTLLNDVLFTGPSRTLASSSETTSTMYYFDIQPTFNMLSSEKLFEDGELVLGAIPSLIKSIGCISGTCNGSELPFIFNKSVRFDGSEVHPSSNEKTLMNKISRAWFSSDLFNQHPYSASEDNVLVIDRTGINESEYSMGNWDYRNNLSTETWLDKGRLTHLDDEKLTLWYLTSDDEDTGEDK
ncbi:carboxylesterase family protein [Vibrio crassostreae]|uniref:carboxylesterase family protein n=1 Tax=Vibrio crassostreae TaxID=246167 RepID=UPI00104AAFCF|nr:carboxylesterase family protein [Vibrio crassostreae]TCN96262.1 carboxylesterase family protein [Vibrio crassostreae]CAK1759754.1 Carboxylesterase family protein [Vibrio crassostreae]CAK1787638.1 Carboxylesterase family protein [Vibrio crassostreae]CAK2159251.1 Carboxylesterase family protein [Vibrio crassostreae]CAK2557324.1 Carboxylesterase family protein [Vibrio crassostreae]